MLYLKQINRILCLPHNYKALPPLWRLEELLELTDEHPSALRWVSKDSFVTRQQKQSGFYLVSVDNEVFLAHRIVYYMRTGECPDNFCVCHGFSNKTKDNRQELVRTWIPKKKTTKQGWKMLIVD